MTKRYVVLLGMIATIANQSPARAQPPQFAFNTTWGPSDVAYQGTYDWGVLTNATACIGWYHSLNGTSWTPLQTHLSVTQSGIQLNLNSTSQPSFFLKAVATKQGFDGYCTPLLGQIEHVFPVNVASPLHPQLVLTSFDGPELIFTEGQYSWTLGVSGGSGSYAINWYAAYDDNPQDFIWFWNGPTGYLYVGPCDGGFHLYYTIQSGGQIIGPFAGGSYVFNFIFAPTCLSRP